MGAPSRKSPRTVFPGGVVCDARRCHAGRATRQAGRPRYPRQRRPLRSCSLLLPGFLRVVFLPKLGSIVKAARRDNERVLRHLIDEPVLVIDSPRPETLELMAQRFGFA